MRNSRIFILSILSLLASVTLGAQNLTDLLIGEVLVENTCGMEDDFGQRNGWIEIFNTSSGTVKFGGCYLSDDKSNLKKYHIPTSDLAANLGPRQSIVFHASGNASQGTPISNFTEVLRSTLSAMTEGLSSTRLKYPPTFPPTAP